MRRLNRISERIHSSQLLELVFDLAHVTMRRLNQALAKCSDSELDLALSVLSATYLLTLLDVKETWTILEETRHL